MAQTKLQRRIEACQTANVDVNAKSERERDIANAAYHGFAIMLRERKKSCTSCVARPRAMRRVELAPKNAAVRITLYHSHDFQEGLGRWFN